jgi:hypothetical protein
MTVRQADHGASHQGGGLSRPCAQDVATLEKWVARDRDRTFQYGVELKVRVP